ncbi:MAG: LysR family transcriptional regulator [Pseudomonadota bacterium]
MNCWAEFRTAMMVAKHGSASAAASELGLHRATVSRHIEVVEASLGTTLFLRYTRGVKLTDAGQEMLEVAGRVEDMLIDLKGRTRSRIGQLSGDLILTALKAVAPLLMPAIREYNAAYPEINVSLRTGAELAQLEYGEAHVAIRAGIKPAATEYNARLLRRVQFGFFAHRDYLKSAESKKKKPSLSTYDYIGATTDIDKDRSPYVKWLHPYVPNPNFALRVNDFDANLPAILAKVGVGALADHVAENFEELTAVIPPSKEMSVPLWMVTHRDLKNVAKVEEFVRIVIEMNGTKEEC